MKIFNFLCNGAILALALCSITACSDDSCDDFYDVIKIDFSTMPNIPFNEEGYWEGVYDTTTTKFTINEITFSHQASATEWEGYTYYSWYGFCPSKVTDNTDYSNSDWTSHQWGAITGSGLSGTNDPYILGFWNSSERTDSIPETPACHITYEGGAFTPKEIYITNSAWGYYAMKNGSAFNKQFCENDWCILHIYGVKNKEITGNVNVPLANGSEILNTWKCVDLTPLGNNIEMIYFQITSSDTGSWGMNNPAFFCLDNFTITIN